MHLQTFHIMADIHIDIERMIMHSNFLLEVGKSSASNGLSDMERKQYLDKGIGSDSPDTSGCEYCLG